MSRFWSPVVQNLVPYTYGEQPKDRKFIKLNTNENPYGPSPLALEAIRDAVDDDLRLYPDPRASELKSAIAQSLRLSCDHVFIGNGSDEVLAHAFNGFFRDKGEILFPDVTYSFYPTYCQLYGIPFRTIPLDAQYQIDPDDYRGASSGIVIANPNAPTGIALGLDAIRCVLSKNPNAVVLIDEAYVDFGAESAVSLVEHYDNLLVVQTFSKSRSLAGMRIGFAVGQPHLIEGLQRIKDSFNSYPLDKLALVGATAAWRDLAWFENARDMVIAEREALGAGLQEQQFRVLPSKANFVFVSHPSVSALRLLGDLRNIGILVRHFQSDRTGDWLRISIGTSQECRQLLAGFRGIIARATA